MTKDLAILEKTMLGNKAIRGKFPVKPLKETTSVTRPMEVTPKTPNAEMRPLHIDALPKNISKSVQNRPGNLSSQAIKVDPSMPKEGKKDNTKKIVVVVVVLSVIVIGFIAFRKLRKRK